SNWYSWKWPIDEESSGFIFACELPNVDDWTKFSPTKIDGLIKQQFTKPEPTFTPHSMPKEKWSIPIPDVTEDKFPLKLGWAVKGKQKFGKKGCGKRMPKIIELIEEANNNNFTLEQIPKVETIRNWISRYSSAMKKDISDKMLEKNNVNNSSSR
ncbi:10144_t:CDS:2, partial [Entrophospora sp. SA101]